MGKKKKKRFQRGEKRWKRAVERGREALPRPGGSMAEVPLKRPIFIRVWVEGKKKLLVIRAKKRNFGTTNRGTHLDGIFPLPPSFSGGKTNEARRTFFVREKEEERRRSVFVRTCCSLRGEKRKVRIVSRQSRIPNVGYNLWLLRFY